MLDQNLADRIVSNLARHKDLDILISDEIALNSAATTEGVSIEAGSYVYRVALFNPNASAFSGADVDVGDGDSADRYIDGLTGLAAADIAIAPVPGSGVASDEVAGHYYASADTIDVKVNSTADSTVQVMAWFFKV
jgi:hypothetical protein